MADPRIMKVMTWCARATGVAPDELECADLLRAIDEPWVLASERLPEHMARVEFVLSRDRNPNFHVKLGVFNANHGSFTSSYSWGASEVTCWRPARPVGELPTPGEGKGGT